MPTVNHFTAAEKAVLLADAQVHALVDDRDWAALAVYLMATVAGLQRSSISRGEMLRGLLPAVARLPARPEAEQKHWDRILGIVQATETITLSDAGVRAMITSGVTAGLLTQSEADVILLEPCARIEQLLGRRIPTPVSQDELQTAFAP